MRWEMVSSSREKLQFIFEAILLRLSEVISDSERHPFVLIREDLASHYDVLTTLEYGATKEDDHMNRQEFAEQMAEELAEERAKERTEEYAALRADQLVINGMVRRF